MEQKWRKVLWLLGWVGLLLMLGGGLLWKSASAHGQAEPEVGKASLRLQQGDEKVPDANCLVCHQESGLRTALPDGTPLDLTVDYPAYRASAHGQKDVACVDCHQDIQGYPHHPVTAATWRAWLAGMNQSCRRCHEDEAEKYDQGDHARAGREGNPNVALCTDCHGAHEMVDLKGHPQAVVQTCGRCHADIYEKYRQSVHGAALMEEGNPDVPTCVDCHQNHANAGPIYRTTFHLMSPEVCAKCHADKELMAKYGLSTHVMDTYVGDFHGKTVLIFEKLYPDQQTNKPVCVDCHGVHDILPPTDANSPVMQANLLRTCQRCHPNARSLNFPKAWLGHYPPDRKRAPLATFVHWFYAIVIPLTIGGMAFFVMADAFRRLRRRKGEGES